MKCTSRFLLLISIVLAMACLAPATASGDEGMWLFNRLPKEYLEKTYNFDPDETWSDHLMKSSVRFNVGGSASFVSSNGLVLTNHHVGSDTLHKLSDADNNYFKDGFLAKSPQYELKAPDLELNQLVSITDVTDQVESRVKPSMSATEAAHERRSVIADIEQQATEKTGNRCDVITLYGGGRYHLYEYKKYTDVRLVWAPEADAAFFGGDADNFEYPRYCLDACLFRVYEDDQPAQIEHFLKWNDHGAKEGDLVFVSGNPGSTSRIYTTAALQYERDVRMPYVLDFIRRREILLQQFGLGGPELKRQAEEELLGFQNSRKAYMGMLAGLQDPRYMKQKTDEEAALIARIQSDPKLKQFADAWQQIAEVQQQRAELQKRSFSLNTRIFNIAQTLVRMAIEDEKPNTERLEEFRDSNRESLRRQLLSPAPIYPELEQTKLADLIGRTLELRGADDPLCLKILDGKSPADRASELVRGTRLFDVNYRRELADGGVSSIQASGDPNIQLALAVDDEARQLREKGDELDEIERQAYGKISEALFAIKGTSVYPDATFTLRLAFGVVKGYEEDGKSIPPWTTMAGAFEHEKAHNAEHPWKLPESWHQARPHLDGSTPLNFVCTADIIGGNSGSPVVNREGELVGLIFDGNIQSLTSDFFYTDKQGRATSVHAGAIREALRKIYDASWVAGQLGR